MSIDKKINTPEELFAQEAKAKNALPPVLKCRGLRRAKAHLVNCGLSILTLADLEAMWHPESKKKETAARASVPAEAAGL